MFSWSRIEYVSWSKAYVVGAAVESNVHEKPSQYSVFFVPSAA